MTALSSSDLASTDPTPRARRQWLKTIAQGGRRGDAAAAWLMLVVAELLAAQEGLAYQIIIAQRFRATDSMWAILIVFGVIGLLSDLGLRALRNVVAPWNRP